jgi:curved DNA-binding protein CbpA
MKNYYTILQIPEDADHDDIQQAYRKLAKQYHPDVNKSPDAHEKFCEITEAYEFFMEHWPRHAGQYSGSESYQQKYDEHRQTDIYEHFQREARERAQRQAQMRYEKFKKQHEAFQESGINDIGLLLTIIMRVFSLFLLVFLILTPIILTFLVHWTSIFIILLMWPFAIGIGWYYRDNRKNYFLPGSFYYSFDRIRHLYTDKHPTTQHCYYCPYKMADSRPYKLDLLKLKDVKIKTGGYWQHNVNYVNQSTSILVPRSQKAFIIHSLNILIKLFSILGCLIFLDISSIIWRIILGMALGVILTRMHLIITRTRSNITYLISYGFLLRIALWIGGISLVSIFYVQPFDIFTTDFIHLVIGMIIIFDSFVMQLISIVLGKYASNPVLAQFPEITRKFNEGYIVYNDVPVISFIYPLFKLIFG